MSYMGRGHRRVSFAMSRAALDFWVGIVDAMAALDNDQDEELYLPVTSGP